MPQLESWGIKFLKKSIRGTSHARWLCHRGFASLVPEGPPPLTLFPERGEARLTLTADCLKYSRFVFWGFESLEAANWPLDLY